MTRLVGGKIPQIFVEYHFVFKEPFEWFKGGPTLTSKLPLKSDSDVRAFRKDLHDFEVQQQAAEEAEKSATPPAKDNQAKATAEKTTGSTGATGKKN